MKNTRQETNRSFLFFIAITAALGGFLFGYDTAVISGTISFVKGKFELNTVMEGWFVSSALVGCIAGVAFAGEISDRFGRKYSLVASGLLFSISALGCALSGSHTELIIYRLIGGIGVGVASMLSPLYISEVSPARVRGRMVALYQFAITLGILCAYFANAYMLNLSESLASLDPEGLWHRLFVEEVWRAMFGSEAIPALLFLVTMFFVPSSPRWLATKNRNTEAGKVLERINNKEIAEKELESIKVAIARESEGSWSVLLQKGILVAVMAGIGLSLLSQFTGINAIIYYGPRIMEEAGIKLSDALGGQVIIGFVNMAATIYAILKKNPGCYSADFYINIHYFLCHWLRPGDLGIVIGDLPDKGQGTGHVCCHPGHLGGYGHHRAGRTMDAGNAYSGRDIFHICDLLHSGPIYTEKDPRDQGDVIGGN
jgi:sugar porter (SP) family MFS transporter